MMKREDDQQLFDRKERFWGDVIYGVMWLVGQLPSFVHYFFADIIAWLLLKVFRYRVDVVQDNLRRSFPDQTDNFIRKATVRYYRHLGDLGVEYLMMAGFSRRRYLRHVRMTHDDILHRLYGAGVPNTFMVLGHFGNWEWYTGLQTLLPDTQFYVLYQRQSRVWNYVFYRIRSKFGSKLLDKDIAPRQMISLRKSPESKTFIFVSDQVPSLSNVHLFVPFLSQNTACFTGMERMARAMKAPVVYVSSHRERRGHYTVDIQLLTEDASKESENELTVEFMRRLERDILDQPEMWLWSHRRWKYTIEEVRKNNPDQVIVQK